MPRTILLTLLMAAMPSAFAEQWSFAYYEGDPSVLSGLDWSAISHIGHVAAQPNPDGSLALKGWYDGIGISESLFATKYAAPLIAAAHANGVKVIFDIETDDAGGGANYASATSSANVQTFVDNINRVVTANGYDGVDFDWEGDFGSAYYGNMSSLLTRARQAMGTRLISAAIGGQDDAFWAQQAVKMDRISAMTYDFVGVWNPYSWFNSGLYGDPGDPVWSVDLAKRRAVSAGIPAAKLDIGIPFYGYVSTGGGVTGPRQPNAGNPSLSQTPYHDLVARYDLSHPNWDPVAHAPWIGIANGWVTFDNAQSIAEKVQYAKANGLGGWIIWSLEKDYLNGTHPLLVSVKAAWGGSATGPSIGSFTADPTSIAVGGSSTLSWSTANAPSVSIGGVGSVAASGSVTVSPTATTTYTLSASGNGTTVTASTTVTVTTGSGAPIASGHTYEVIAKNSGKALDVEGGPSATQDGANVQQWTYLGGTNQQWRVDQDGDGSYTLTAINSGRVLDAAGMGTTPGGNVIQWTNWNGPNQHWRIADLGGGWCKVTNANSGLVLDVQGGISATDDGANVEQWTDAGADNQRWRFIDLGGDVVSGQSYKLIAKHSGKALDVEGGPGATQDGANVDQWADAAGATNQLWRIDANGDGSYTLTAQNSGKVLDVSGMSLDDGGNVQQWTNWNGPNQHWRFDDVGGGYFRVTNVNSGKALDVAGISTADGANVQQWTWWGGDNQRWQLVPVAPTGTARGDAPRRDDALVEALGWTSAPEGIALEARLARDAVIGR